MNISERLALIRGVGVFAVVRAPTADLAIRAVDSLVHGGITGIEITYSTPDVPTVLASLRQRHDKHIVLGAGTVLEITQAIEAVEAGAQFRVSPGLDEEVASVMLATGATTMAGALTPTEVMRAIRLGVHVVKLFPGWLAGPDYLRTLQGPFPNVAVMPTGGVSVENLDSWLRSGALAVGVGSELVSAADIREGRWEEIRAKAGRFMTALGAARAQRAAT
jgi:2-dehydro-3-deoxyphosphogluconate aldolase/(4S)-4-hydroxy-2-oxoglutarate aldolase